MSDSHPRIRILGAAFLFSTGGAAVKACSLTSWQVACCRSAVAAATLLVLLPDARRSWTWRTLLVGCAYAGTMICFVTANKLTTAASTIFLQDVAPLYVLLLSPWLLHERIRRRDLLFMVAMIAGMVLLLLGTGAPAATAPDPARGNAIAVLSGVGWALTVIGLRWMARGSQAGKASAGGLVAGNVLASLICLPFALAQPLDSSVGDWLVVVYLGVFQIAIAYAWLAAGIRHVTALEASLLLLLEPVLNPLWAFLTQGETAGALSLAGGAVILVATLVKAWWESRENRRSAALLSS